MVTGHASTMSTGGRTATILAIAVLILYVCAASVCGAASLVGAGIIGPQEDESVLILMQSHHGTLRLSALSPLEMTEDTQIELRHLSLTYSGDGTDFDDESTRLEVSLQSDANADNAGKFRFTTHVLGGIHFPTHDMRGDSGVLTMIGTVSSLNSALGGLSFTPPRNYHGTIEINAGLRCLNCDEYDTQVHQRLSVNVLNVNDPLKILWNGKEFIDRQIVLESDEDSILSLGDHEEDGTGLSLLDVDDDIGNYVDVMISSERGQICLFQQNKTDAPLLQENDLTLDTVDEHYDCKDGAKGLTLSGVLPDINGMLDTLLYVPPPNWWGFDTMTVDAVGQNETSRELLVRVNGVNDSPVLRLDGTYEGHITAPHLWSNLTLTTAEDSTLEITALSVHDNDCSDHLVSRCILEVRATVQHGRLSVQQGSFASALRNEDGRSITLRGTDSDLNQALHTLSYTPSKNFHGFDRLQATVFDFGLDSSGGEDQLSFTRYINISVESTPDAPVITLPLNEDAVLTIQEDVDGVIGGDCDAQGMKASRPIMSCESIRLQDADNIQDSFNVTLTCTSGMLHLPHLKDHAVEYALADVNGTFARTTHLRGGADAINSVLDGTIYRGDINYNGLDEVTIFAIGSVDGMSSSSTILIKVEAKNDAPLLIVDGEHYHDSKRTGDGLSMERTHVDPLVVLEDEPSRINSMEVRDVDMSPQSAFVELTVKAVKGSVRVDEEATIQKWVLFSDWDSRHDYQKKIRFQCNLESANKALKQLWYRPPKGFAGDDNLTIAVSDLGTAGASNEEEYPLRDTATIPIIILDQEDHPILSVPAIIEVMEDVPTFVVPPVAAFHPDSTDEEIKVSIMCTHGYVKLSSVNGLNLTNGSVGYGSHISGIGTVSSWNSALVNLTYTTEQDRVDMDEVHFSVANSKRPSLAVNAMHENYKMLVDARPVNDPPEWIVPGRNLVLQNTGGYTVESVDTLFVDEDQELTLTSIRISDVDLNDREDPSQTFIVVKLKATSGTIKLATTEGLFFFEGADESRYMFWKGTKDNSNAALSTVVYRGSPDFHGDDVLECYVSDEGNIGAGGPISSAIDIPITVLPVRDSPSIITPDFPLVCGEEQWCSIPSLVILDPDNVDSLVRIEVSVEKGRLSFGRNEYPSTLRFLRGTYAGDKSFRMSGPLGDVNSLLADLAYMGRVGTCHEIDTIHVNVWTGEAEARTNLDHPDWLTAIDEIHILIVNTVNNGPSIQYSRAVYRADDGCAVTDGDQPAMSPSVRDNVKCKRLVDIPPFSCLEDMECSLSFIGISDPDSDVVEVSLKVEKGALAMTNSSLANAFFLVGASGPLPRRDSGLPQRQLVVRGSVEGINSALEGLVYLADQDVFGRDELRVIVKDVNTRESSDVMQNIMKDELNIPIEIASVDDPPRLVGPTDVLETNEDRFMAITGLVVLDADLDDATDIDRLTSHGSRIIDDEGLIELRIDVVNGSIRLASVAGLNFTTPHSGSSETWYGLSPNNVSLQQGVDMSAHNLDDMDIRHQHWWNNVKFRGRLSDVNNAIKQLTFRPPQNWNSEGNTYAEVQVNVRNAQPSENNDDTFKVFIRVMAENDAPVVTFHTDSLSMDTNGSALLIVDEDADAIVVASVTDIDDSVLEIEIVAHMGHVSLANRTATCFECGDLDDVSYIKGSGQRANTVVFKGTVEAVNAKLGSLLFAPTSNYNGEAALTITARDARGAEGGAELKITVTPLEDEVHLFLPVEASGSKPLIVLDEGDRILIGSGWYATDYVLRNTASSHDIESRHQMEDHKEIHGMGEQAFYISDNDITRNDHHSYHVELSVPLGTLLLDCTPDCDGVLFHDNINSGASIRFSGTLEGVNKVARRIIFVAEEDESGPSQLNIKLSDRNCAAWDDISVGMATGDVWCDEVFDFPTAEGSLDIFVVAVNSAPSIRQVGGEALTQVPLDAKKVPIAGFAVDDEDVSESTLEGTMTVNLSASKGRISLHALDGLSFVHGSGVDDSKIEFHAALPDVNVALSQLYFSCLANDGCMKGDVEVALVVDDNGFTGKGGPKEDSMLISIQVLA